MEMKFRAYFLCLVFVSAVAGSRAEDGAQRVLFLGNSVWDYQGGVPQAFIGFCEAEGLSFSATSQMKDRANRHGIEFLDIGRIPLSLPEVAARADLLEAIRSGGYDYVVLEGRRSGYLLPSWVDRPEDRGASIPYAENLTALGAIHRAIVESGGRTVLYIHPGLKTTPELKLPVAEIYRRLRTDLEGMVIGGETHSVILVPASQLWLDGVRRYGLDNWFADRGHGAELARFASGCLLFTYITGKDPRGNGFRSFPKPWTVSADTPARRANEDDADWVARQVWLYYTSENPDR